MDPRTTASPDHEYWHLRRRMLGLTRRDHELTRRLRTEVIAPKLDALVDAFREFLAPLYAELPAFDRDVLRQRQADYLLTFGEGFDSDSYLAARMRIGAAHVHWSIPLSDYSMAHHFFQGLIVDRILGNGFSLEEARELVDCAARITAFDMALVVHAYHVTAVEELEHELESQKSQTRRYQLRATRDPLTGLHNRRAVSVNLAQQAARARARGEPLSVGMADLDRFKLVNDAFGHPVGDEVLRIAAKRMSGALRGGGDLLARYGGEEFLFLLPGAPLDQAREVAERLRAAVAATPFGAEGHTIPVTVSVGVAALRADEDATALIARADAALYRAKGAGRDCVEVDA